MRTLVAAVMAGFSTLLFLIADFILGLDSDTGWLASAFLITGAFAFCFPLFYFLTNKKIKNTKHQVLAYVSTCATGFALLLTLNYVFDPLHSVSHHQSWVGNCNSITGWFWKTPLGSGLGQGLASIFDPTTQNVYYMAEEVCRLNKVRALFQQDRSPLCSENDSEATCFRATVREIHAGAPLSVMGIPMVMSIGSIIVLYGKQKEALNPSSAKNALPTYRAAVDVLALTLDAYDMTMTRARPERQIPGVSEEDLMNLPPEIVLLMKQEVEDPTEENAEALNRAIDEAGTNELAPALLIAHDRMVSTSLIQSVLEELNHLVFYLDDELSQNRKPASETSPEMNALRGQFKGLKARYGKIVKDRSQASSLDFLRSNSPSNRDY